MTQISLNGAVGRLEAFYSEAEVETGRTAILCHPHPLFGGSMNDMVLCSIERALLSCGINSLRFNFRSVGKSEGHHADGVGEVDDVVAVANWIREKSPDETIILVGYSFGGAVALSARRLVLPKSLLLIAPAIRMFDAQDQPASDSLVIFAENDQFVSAKSTMEWFKDCQTKVEQIPNTDHFFVGCHDKIGEIVTNYVNCRSS